MIASGEPPNKRAKTSPKITTAGVAPSAAEIIDLTGGDDTPAAAPSHAGALDSPLHLFAVRGIPDWANEGFLGAKLSQILSGPGLQWALVSNYMIDMAWLLSACPALRSVPSMLVVHGERGAAAKNITTALNAAGMGGRFALHTPWVPEYGTYHSKAFLLHYPRGLRVVIHTANLLFCDANNKSQGLFYQDFPLKDDASPRASTFQSDLLEYIAGLRLLAAQGRHVRELIEKHDFSMARVHLIASVPSGAGEHSGSKISAYGHMKLRACLNNEPGGFANKFSGAPVAAQFSSVGSIAANWLKNFIESLAAGHSQSGRPLDAPSATQLVWPTTAEIQNSLEGWFAGGSVPGYPDKVRRPLLQALYCRWGGEEAGRQRAMPHIKSYVRYDAGSSAGSGKEVAWFCLTSHNLSKAAWGEVQNSKQYNRQLLKVLSYELGVLCVPSLELAYRKSRWHGFSCTEDAATRPVGPLEGVQSVRFVQWERGASQQPSLVVSGNGGVLTVPLPIPYSLPPKKYDAEDVPWDTRSGLPPREAWQGVDSLGAGFPGVGSHYGVLDQMEWGDVVQAMGGGHG